jgi:hypothetical protein
MTLTDELAASGQDDSEGEKPMAVSETVPEAQARDYGGQKTPADPAMTPEQWVAEEKLMPGALQGYTYVEEGGAP